MGKQLTPKMFTVLSELDKPKAMAFFMPYMGSFRPNAYYFLSAENSTVHRCTAQIRGLVARGLVEYFDVEQFGEHNVRISAAGRKFHKRKAKP